MSEKLNKLLDKLGAEMLSAEAKQQIIKEFEALIAEKAKIHVQAATEKLDAEHAMVLEKVLANIDADHANKFKVAMERIDKSYAHKLKLCKERFNKCINADAKAFKNKLTNALSVWLESALKDYIPDTTIAESVQAKHNEKMLNELRNVLGVDLAFANAKTVNAFKKQRAQIMEAKKHAANVSKKYAILKEQAKKANTNLLVEKVINKLKDPEEREFMKRRMSGKPINFVKENFDYVLNLYRNEKDLIEEDIKEQAKRKVLTEKAKTDGFVKQIPAIKQPKVEQPKDMIMESYLAGLSD